MKRLKTKSKKVRKTVKNSHLPLLLPLLIVSLVVGGVFLSQINNPTSVLGEQTSNSGKNEQVKGPEKSEEVEPKETPDPKEAEHEQEAKDIQHEVESQVQQGTVEKVEVHPSPATPNAGSLKLEKSDGTTSEKTVPVSKTSLISVPNSQSGPVQVSVGANGTVRLVNNGITVTTDQPVVIDPKSQTVGIKTATGVTLISTLPSQAINDLQPSEKPTVVQSAVLGEQNGQVYYDVVGIQKRKFVGIIPVNAHVETKINAQNGTVISSNKPWYLNFLGFLYTI